MKEFEDPITPQDHEMLRIVPNEFIVFSREENTESNIEISSLMKIPITYKIQTTSPAKFRVRPRCGFIMPGETIPISILLKHDHQLSETSKDKFLVMSMVVPPGVDTNVQQPAELWLEKTVGTKGVEQNRLICTYKADDHRDMAAPGTIRKSCGSAQQNSRPDGGKSYVGASGPECQQPSKQVQMQPACRRTQISQWITWVWLALLSVGLCYLLMQDRLDSRGSVASKYNDLNAHQDRTCQSKIRT